MPSAELIAHLAALLLVAGTIVTRLRVLRLLATLAGVAAAVSFVLAGTGFVWVLWAGLFAVVNLVHFAALEMRARSGKLLEEERALFDEVMRITEPGQQRHLRDLINWRDIAVGDCIMRQGESAPPLLYVALGRAEIDVDGKRVGECGPGDFLGEMSLISGKKASATVCAAEPMRVAYFDRDALAQLSRTAPEIGRALDSALNRSLSGKVVRMNETLRTHGAGGEA